MMRTWQVIICLISAIIDCVHIHSLSKTIKIWKKIINLIRSDIHFKDIVDLYCFDRRLRSLVFNAIEKIEVALRTRMVQIYCESTGDSHWYENESLFKDTCYLDANGEEEFCYNKLLNDIEHEVERSNEDFIGHYKTKYSEPENPPAWMTLEVVSFGTLSRFVET